MERNFKAYITRSFLRVLLDFFEAFLNRSLSDVP